MMKDHDEWYGGILYSLRVADRSEREDTDSTKVRLEVCRNGPE